MTQTQQKGQKATIFVSVLTSYITTFTSSALNLSVPDIGTQFHISAALTGWIVTGYILSSSAFSVPFGRLADLAGRKRILIGGIGIFALSSFACCFAGSFGVLLALRILQGLGAAMIFSTNIAMLVGAFPPERQGGVLGLSTASTYIGLSSGPVIGGILNHQAGWHSVFLATALLSGVVFFAAVKLLPEEKKQEREIKPQDRDVKGNCLYVLTLGLLLYGFSSVSQGIHGWICAGAGLALLWAFIRHEQQAPSPVVQVRFFRENPAYFLSNLAALLNYAATFAIGYVLSVYLQVAQDFDSQTAGLILICQPAVMAVLSPYAGRLSDRVSPFLLASIGMGLSAAGLLWFSFLEVETPLWFVIAGLLIVGTGFGFFSSPNTNAIMSCVSREDSGVASSLLATMRTVGQTSSMALVTLVSSLCLGRHTFETASAGEMALMAHDTFLVCAIICGAGILVSAGRRGKKEAGRK